MGIERGSRVLVPSYICCAAVDPLLAYGVDVDFYAVNRDCSIDLPDLERRITPTTRAVIVVHYFGFPQPLRKIKLLCDSHRITLIEDCAHVLTGENEGEPVGTAGDAAVFSWRKFLPIYDGAELVINRPGHSGRIEWAKESSIFTMKVAANMLDASLVQARQPVLKLAYRGIRTCEAVFRRYANSHWRNSPMMKVETTAVSFDAQSVNWPMSRLSRWTKNHSDIEHIIARRRRNYEVLLQELSAIKEVTPLYPQLPPNVCPWVFPVLFAGLRDAHVSLRHRGIPAATWGGVQHPQIPQHSFPNSRFLYEKLVFLPVHQCLEDKDLVNIAATVQALCKKKLL